MDTCYEDQWQHGIYLYVYFIYSIDFQKIWVLVSDEFKKILSIPKFWFFITSPNLHNKGSWFAFISLCLTFSISLSLNLWPSSSQCVFQAGRKKKYQQECLEKVFFFCRWSISNSLVLKSQRNGKPFVVYFYRDVSHSLNLFRFNEICWVSIDFTLALISFVLEAVKIDLIICLSCLFHGIFLLFLISKLFIMIPIIGETR